MKRIQLRRQHRSIILTPSFTASAALTQSFDANFGEYLPDYTLEPLILTVSVPYVNPDSLTSERPSQEAGEATLEGDGICVLTNILWEDFHPDGSIQRSNGGKTFTIANNGAPNVSRSVRFTADVQDLRTGETHPIEKTFLLVCVDATDAPPRLSVDVPGLIVYDPLLQRDVKNMIFPIRLEKAGKPLVFSTQFHRLKFERQTSGGEWEELSKTRAFTERLPDGRYRHTRYSPDGLKFSATDKTQLASLIPNTERNYFSDEIAYWAFGQLSERTKGGRFTLTNVRQSTLLRIYKLGFTPADYGLFSLSGRVRVPSNNTVAVGKRLDINLGGARKIGVPTLPILSTDWQPFSLTCEASTFFDDSWGGMVDFNNVPIGAALEFDGFCLVKGDQPKEWRPANDALLSGTSPAEQIGEMISNNPIPSMIPSEYTWKHAPIAILTNAPAILLSPRLLPKGETKLRVWWQTSPEQNSPRTESLEVQFTAARRLSDYTPDFITPIAIEQDTEEISPIARLKGQNGDFPDGWEKILSPRWYTLRGSERIPLRHQTLDGATVSSDGMLTPIFAVEDLENFTLCLDVEDTGQNTFNS